MRVLVSLLTIAICAGLVGGFYAWKLRPMIERLPQYAPYLESADSHLARAWEWLKLRKLEAVAGLALVAPEIPDLINQLSGFDWSPLGARGTLIVRGLGIASLAAKFVLLKRTIGS